MTDILRLRTDGLSWREIEGEIVAIDQGTSVYLAGNRAAGLLWPLLAEGCSEAALTECLMRNFGIDEAQAAADVTSFLAALRSRGYLK